MTKYTKLTLAAATVAGMACCSSAVAQSADALIDKLVDKGVLTVKEANDLRQESDKNFNSAYSEKTGMPDWVNGIKFNGDFRARTDYLSSDNSLFSDRYRLRYRVRFGATVVMKDDFEVNLTLGSGDAGGNALSNNTTLENNGTKKPIWVDKAYAKWTPLHNGDWTLSGTIGKMANPFETSPMVYDPDYTPEGAALQLKHNFSDEHSLQFNGGAFVLDENGNAASGKTANNPALFGAQVLWNAKWTPKLASTLGAAIYDISNPAQLTTLAVPDNNVGNTRTALGVLVNDYHPYVFSGNATYTLESFPLYEGAFPIKLGGEYMENPGADSNNKGYWAGVTFGKSGKRGTWDLSYRYQRLESDAWYEELVDDDNVAYYQAAQVGGRAGMLAGTNIKGHQVKLNYSITDALTFTLTGYFNNLINPSPAGSDNGGTHVMADLMWKF
jgi:hypothetical protein